MAKQGSTPRVITKKHLARLERERRQSRLIVGIAIAGIVIVLGLLGYGYLDLNVLQFREPVAEVNGVKITTGEWQERVRYQRAILINYYNQYSFIQQSYGFDYSQQLQQIASMLQVPDTVGKQALDQMTDEILIRQEAEKRGITVSKAELDEMFQESFGFFPDGTPSPTVTPTEFSYPTLTGQQLTLYPSTPTPTEVLTATPASTATPDPSVTSTPTATAAPPSPTPVPEIATVSPTPYTLDGYQTDYNELLENYKSFDVSEETIRSVYEAQLLREKLLDEFAKDIPKQEEQVWARHILVETEAEAKAAYDLLQGGADFAQLARTTSKDTGSAENGGDMGWHDRGYFVPEFSDAAFSQEIGVIGKPVKSQFGYHIIQVLGRQVLPLDPSQYEQKKQTALTDWLTAAREEAKITTYDIWMERVPTDPALQTQLPQ